MRSILAYDSDSAASPRWRPWSRLPERLRRERTRAYVFLLLTAVLWGSVHPAAQGPLQEISAPHFAFLRALLAALVLLSICTLSGRLGTVATELATPLRAALLGCMGFAGTNVLSMSALLHASPGAVSVLTATGPIFVVVAAPLVRESPGRWGIVGTLLGFAGAAALASDSGERTASAVGVALSLISAAVWATYILMMRGIRAPFDPLAQTTLAAVIGTIALAVVTRGWEVAAALATVTPSTIAGILWCGIAGLGLPYVLWVSALQSLPAARVAPFQYVRALSSVVLAWIFLAQPPTPLLVGGGAVLLVGVALAQRTTRLVTVPVAESRPIERSHHA